MSKYIMDMLISYLAHFGGNGSGPSRVPTCLPVMRHIPSVLLNVIRHPVSGVMVIGVLVPPVNGCLAVYAQLVAQRSLEWSCAPQLFC